MSTGPDDPTRPVPPQQPREPYMRERVVEQQDPWREEVLDRLSSLRTAVVLVGVLAAIALGVAAYALIDANDNEDGNNGRTAASAERVSDLEQEVEQLDARVDERATKNQVSELSSDVEELQDQVRQLSQQQSGGGSDDAQQAVEGVQNDVQELEERVNDLEQQQSEGGTTP